MTEPQTEEARFRTLGCSGRRMNRGSGLLYGDVPAEVRTAADGPRLERRRRPPPLKEPPHLVCPETWARVRLDVTSRSGLQARMRRPPETGTPVVRDCSYIREKR